MQPGRGAIKQTGALKGARVFVAPRFCLLAAHPLSFHLSLHTSSSGGGGSLVFCHLLRIFICRLLFFPFFFFILFHPAARCQYLHATEVVIKFLLQNATKAETFFVVVVLVVAFELCCCDARALGARQRRRRVKELLNSRTVEMERKSPARGALKEEVGASKTLFKKKIIIKKIK